MYLGTFVLSRTPTQVAKHAQKYFQRMSMVNKARKRSSIHDITILGDGKLSIQQMGTTEQGAGGGFTVDTQSIGDKHCELLSQGSGSNQIMRAADAISCAPMITSQHNVSALQVPFGEQMTVVAAEVVFSNTLITCQHGMSNLQGLSLGICLGLPKAGLIWILKIQHCHLILALACIVRLLRLILFMVPLFPIPLLTWIT